MTRHTPYVQFFAGAPRIARYVQSLVIEDVQISLLMEKDKDSNSCGLGILLESLPSLWKLELVNVTTRTTTTVGGMHSSRETMTELVIRWFASHPNTIKMDGITLVYRDRHHRPLVQCANFVMLLALFAEIGELCVDVGVPLGCEADELPDVVDDPDLFIEHVVSAQAQLEGTSGAGLRCTPRIGKLTCQGGWVGVFFIPTYLVRLGVLGGLTHLTATLTYAAGWKSFF